MSIGLIGILLLLALLLLLASGTPIAFCLGFLGTVGIIGFLDIGTLYQIAEVAADTCTNLFFL